MDEAAGISNTGAVVIVPTYFNTVLFGMIGTTTRVAMSTLTEHRGFLLKEEVGEMKVILIPGSLFLKLLPSKL